MLAANGLDAFLTLLTFGAVFLAVALAAGLLVQRALASTSTERRRLRAVTGGTDVAVLPEIVPLSNAPRADGWQRTAPLLGLSTKEFARLRSRLTRAGYSHPSAAIVYSVCERVLPLAAAA